MSRRRTILFALLLVTLALILLASACTIGADRNDPSAAYTAGASTLIARLTQDAGGTAVAQLTQFATQNAAQPTGPRLTPPPKEPATATSTPIPTDTFAPRPPAEVEEPSPTPVPPTPTAVSAPCNRMTLIGDVTVPADSVFPAGTVINKVWRVQNTGSCSWSSGYGLMFNGGNLTSAPVTGLPGVVAPGQTVDVSVALIAPGQAGIYQGTWVLRSDTGELFAAGTDGSVPLFARIQVPQAAANPVSSFDIATAYCSGEWTSAVGVLFCPGASGDEDGWVSLVQAPTLENGRSGGYGLWTRPNQGSGGWISGQMPLLSIRNGDHFLAEIGCLSNSPDCDVNFQLDYRTAGGATGRLGRWRETSDGSTTMLDVDLSSLSGRNVFLILSVFNRGRSRDANAFWLLPRIEQGGAPRPNTITWTREGLPDEDSCDELHIYHTGTNTVVAVAYDCSVGLMELGRMTLSAAQVEQLRAWEARLDNFEGELYSASGGNPVISWVVFRASGRSAATDGDIHSLESFASQIFFQITH